MLVFPLGGTIGLSKNQRFWSSLNGHKCVESCFIVSLGVQLIPAAPGHVFTVVLASSQTGQGPLELQSSVGAEEDVKEGVQ